MVKGEKMDKRVLFCFVLKSDQFKKETSALETLDMPL